MTPILMFIMLTVIVVIWSVCLGMLLRDKLVVAQARRVVEGSV